MKVSKNRKSALERIQSDQSYSVSEAVKLMKETNSVKFDATAEIHLVLGVDPRHADQQVRATVSLPHGTGKKVRVIVFCDDAQAKLAKAAGATEAGNDSLIEKVSGGWLDFDVVIATPDQMRAVAKLARVLGPKGLMPSPKAGTVVPKVEDTVKEIVAGRIEFRNDKNSIIHSLFGKLSFTQSQLEENLNALIKAIKEAKPSGSKGEYLKKLTINSTMGVGISLALDSL